MTLKDLGCEIHNSHLNTSLSPSESPRGNNSREVALKWGISGNDWGYLWFPKLLEVRAGISGIEARDAATRLTRHRQPSHSENHLAQNVGHLKVEALLSGVVVFGCLAG